jgi:FkbH-like protein
MKCLNLPWLPPPPGDFRSVANALDLNRPDIGQKIRSLATFALSSNQAAILAKVIRRHLETDVASSDVSRFRLGILGSATYDLMLDDITVAAARHGVALDVANAPYDQVLQEAMDANASIHAARCDAILIAVDYRWLGLTAHQADVATTQSCIDAAGERLNSVVRALQSHGSASIILCTLATPPGALHGSYDAKLPGSVKNQIAAVNNLVLETAAKHSTYVLDVAALAAEIGTSTWFDPIQWNLYKLPFAAECNQLFADHVGRILGAIRGKSKKCLVLDLDNTLWGGVIGDDGLEGIRIGQGNAEGEAHLAVQKLALEYRNKGVMLAVCSKNNEENARLPFQKHPDMLLKETDISVFQANWIDKPANLEAIAKSLNIGLDALVFLDDNPAERAHVRAALPMVGVPEVGADPGLFAAYLQMAGYFEAVTVSDEDRIRANTYAEEAKRVAVMQSTQTLGDYLSALEMVISFAPFDSLGRQRITQLINKSNQFNLTTRRYTEQEIATLETAAADFTMQVRLKDKFGDSGMIGVIIACALEDTTIPTWDIDTWLMSCRVLGRNVENAMLDALVSAARRNGIAEIVGRYIETKKNGMVADHYPKLGFVKSDFDPVSGQKFRLKVSEYAGHALPMQVESTLQPQITLSR